MILKIVEYHEKTVEVSIRNKFDVKVQHWVKEQMSIPETGKYHWFVPEFPYRGVPPWYTVAFSCFYNPLSKYKYRFWISRELNTF